MNKMIQGNERKANMQKNKQKEEQKHKKKEEEKPMTKYEDVRTHRSKSITNSVPCECASARRTPKKSMTPLLTETKRNEWKGKKNIIYANQQQQQTFSKTQ